MAPLKDKEVTFYEGQKVCHIYKKKFFYHKNKKIEYSLHRKVKDHCHYTGKCRGAAHNICSLRYNVPKKITAAFHNGSAYDYQFIIKQLAEGFKVQFECLGENTEKCITFSVPIKEDDNSKKTTHKLNFIGSYRFMQSKLLDLVDNLSKINKNESPKCKGKCEFIGSKNDRLHYRCKERKKNCTKSKDGLIKNFPSIYKFCNGDLNKFLLLIRKGVYPFDYRIAGKDLMKFHYPITKSFTAN